MEMSQPEVRTKGSVSWMQSGGEAHSQKEPKIKQASGFDFDVSQSTITRFNKGKMADLKQNWSKSNVAIVDD